MELYSSNVIYDGKSFNDNCLTICQYSPLTPIIETLLGAIDMCSVDFGSCLSPASSSLPDVIQALVNQSCVCTTKVSSTDGCCGYLIDKFTSLNDSITIVKNTNNHVYGILTLIALGPIAFPITPTVSGGTYSWKLTSGELNLFPVDVTIFIDTTIHSLGTVTTITNLIVLLNALNLGTFTFTNGTISVTNTGCETIDLSANIPNFTPHIVLNSNNTQVSGTNPNSLLQGYSLSPNTLAQNGDSVQINFSLETTNSGIQNAILYIGTTANSIVLPITSSNVAQGSYRITRISDTTLVVTGTFRTGVDMGSGYVSTLYELFYNGYINGIFTVADVTINPLPIQIIVGHASGTQQVINSNFFTVDKFSV